MPRRREIRGVLNGFLGALSSRYSDFGGYWLFGFLVEAPRIAPINLLKAPPEHIPTAQEALERRARILFQQMLRQSGLDGGQVGTASLTLRVSEDTRRDYPRGRWRLGYEVTLAAEATSDLGRRYTATYADIIAPHDPSKEQRSSRAQEPTGARA